MQNINKNRCRICLVTSNLMDIFANEVSKKIMYCTTIQVSPEDSFPSKICKKCEFYLNIALVFRTVCEWTDLKLRQELQQKDSINFVVNNTQEAILSNHNKTSQFYNFSYVEELQNGEGSINTHPIELLLKKDHVRTYKNSFMGPQERHTLEDCDNNFYDKERLLLEKDIGYISRDLCYKFLNERLGLVNESMSEENGHLHQEVEESELINNPVNQVKDNINFTNNTVLVNEQSVLGYERVCLNNEDNIMNFNEERSLISEETDSLSEYSCLINDDSLSTEEDGLVVDINLLHDEDNVISEEHHDEDNVISEEHHDEDNVISEEHHDEDNVISEEQDSSCKKSLNIEKHTQNEEICDEYPSFKENTVSNEEVNFINEGTLTQKHDENSLVDDTSDDGVIYGSKTHPNIYDKSIYGKVCLNTEDPLLLNVTSKATSLESDDIDLRNLQTTEDNHDLKSCFCVQNKTENAEKSANEKHINLASISLHDFENFAKEQLNNPLLDTQNDNNNHSNNKILFKNNTSSAAQRVGRHIAKKNAGQPPKRYSPTPEVTKLTTPTQNLKQNIIKDDDLSIAPKCTKTDEADDKLEKKLELKDMNSILDQEYILENDLSMPVPIFEETIVTDGFYFANDDEEAVESNFDDRENESSEKMEVQVKKSRRRSKNGSAKIKRQKKVNIFRDQTVLQQQIYPKRRIRTNKYNVRVQINEAKLQNYLDQSFSESDVEIDDDESSETNFKINHGKNKTKINHFHSSDDDDDDDKDDYENAQQSQTSSLKRKLPRSKTRKGTNTTCKLCNKSFPFPSHLRRHLTAHIGIKRFICKYCHKEFLHRYNLSVHLRSHTGNFPLQCNICNRGFASPSVLERHKRSHTGETPFQCRYCLQLFSHASSLTMHEKMHLNRPSFPCDVCYKVFSYKSSLNAHKKGHSGFKPHSCSVCHKRFTRRTSVMRHMLCHSEVKKFKCRTCGEVLNSQSSLVKHRKTHQELHS